MGERLVDVSRNLTIRKDFALLYRRVLSLLCMWEMSDVIQASISWSFSMNKQLFAAASEGDLELVKNLLTQGADKEYKDDKVS